MEGEGGAGAGNGITGTIDLGRRSGGASFPSDLTGQVHLLPCCVKHDGPGPVSHYFKPKQTGIMSDGLSVEEAFFRGRKLQGATIPLPDGYCGYVLSKEGNLGIGGDLEGNPDRWVSRAEFRSMTYWNHDSLPSQDDPLVRCFHWFSVANALHKPVTREDLASTSVIQKKL
uniref:Ribonuclease H2 subunit C n=1 Tax=Anthurium amnicola TaxID=1678845 RepID=A0A1D1Y2V9_9ARAE